MKPYQPWDRSELEWLHVEFKSRLEARPFIELTMSRKLSFKLYRVTVRPKVKP